MSVGLAPRLMTGDEFLALPDDDSVRRELIRGILREEPRKLRNQRHSAIEANVVGELKAWERGIGATRGRIVCGEAGFCLRRNPDTYVGVDVAYMSPEQAAANPESVVYPECPPTLVVEILSPSDNHNDVSDKIDLYLESGVGIVWVVDPRFRTIQEFRANNEPRLFTVRDELVAEPFLPGFGVPVTRIFE